MNFEAVPGRVLLSDFGKEPHQGLETKAVREKVSVEITGA
jgi:hypothetical protein